MMMMSVRPEMIQSGHSTKSEVKQASPLRQGSQDAKKQIHAIRPVNACNDLTFAGTSVTLDEYLVEVRIPLVAGPAFPISFGGLCERGKCC
jgi:hypothetical protein